MKTLVRMARDNEVAKWDELLTSNPDGGEIFQSRAMAEIKTLQGWRPEFWVYETSFGTVYATVLTKNLFGVGRLCYMMRGPGVVDETQFAEIIRANEQWEKLAFAVKMEPAIRADKLTLTDEALFKVRDIQPNAHTILVDLSKGEDEILASFRQRARREIRASEKDGIFVQKVNLTDENIDRMYKLYATTGKRAGFFIRPKSYYEKFWHTFHTAGEGELYFAFADGEAEPLAGAYICRLGKKAVYKDGGSRRSSHKHFAHLLQWEVMKRLKASGVTEYDLHGVPPSDQLENKDHPLAGLAMFKLSFAQEVTDFVGAYDQVLNAKKYRKWLRWGQRVHQAWAHHARKTTLY